MSNKQRFTRSLSNGRIPFFNQEERKKHSDEIEVLSPRSINLEIPESELRNGRETALASLFTPRWFSKKDLSELTQDRQRKLSNPPFIKIDTLPLDDLDCDCDIEIPKPVYPKELKHISSNNYHTPILNKNLQWLTLSCKGTPPSPRIHHSSCIVKNIMYIFGGTDGDSLKNQLFALDLQTYTWSHPITSGNKPSHRYGHSCTAVGDLIYIYGGKTKTNILNDFYVLDTNSMVWYKIMKKGSVPPAIVYHTAHYYDKTIYLFGGTKLDGSTMDSIYYFDIEKQTWGQSTLRIKGRSMASSVMISQHKVMIVGGYRSKYGKFKRQIKHPLVIDLHLCNIIPSQSKAPRLYNHSCFIHDNSVLFFGGRDRDLNVSSDLFFYSENWQQITNVEGDQPIATYGQSVVVIQNKIVFFGGMTTNNQFVKDTFMLQVGSLKNNSSHDTAFEQLNQPNPDILQRRLKTRYYQMSELQTCGKIASGATCVVILAKLKTKNVVIKQYYNYDKGLFEKEFKILGGLKHKNIVKFIGCMENAGNIGVILEYHPLGDLFHFIKKQSTSLEWPLILHMALDVAKGMNYLHQNNILHRDLKSSNLLVASTSYKDKVTIKLMDFGDSKEISHKKEEAICGTIRWTAPEVFQKQPYSPKSDVFSFGIILWELISLRTPYEHLKRDYEVEDFVLHGGRPSIQVNINLCYRQLMEACWDQSPVNRPTFDEVILILEDICRKILPIYENDLSDLTYSEEDESEKSP